MPKVEYVYLKIPREHWNLLEETLSLDAESSMFDAAIRGEICAALSSILVLKRTHE